MRVNNPLCDWLTLTTFYHEALLWWLYDGFAPESSRREEKRMQYSGSATQNLFWGTGVQNGDQHAMLQASGEIADRVLWLANDDRLRCTRIDLQVTIDLPKGFSSRDLYDGLVHRDADWDGRRKAISIVQSGDGLDTVYIGSRKSDMLMRIYVKPDAAGYASYIRFECEYKGDKADGVYKSIVGGTHTIANILSFELQRLPALEFGLSTLFWEPLRATGKMPSPKTVPGQSDTIDWLLRQVEPAVIRLLHDHEHGGRMETILKRWLSNSAGHKQNAP